MRRIILCLTSTVFTLTVFSQNTPATDSFPRNATVNVTVTDMKSSPRKGEQVVFRGEKTGKQFSGVTDAAGKYSQLLPPGETYYVSIKSISDTTRYAVVNIPSLEEDEYFTEPFWVKVKYDPPKNFRLDHVHFDTDKSTLRPDSYAELTELLDFLKRHPDIHAEIAGHTDNTGTAERNKKLSQDRADVIRNYLTGKGINAARLTAKGYGADQPVADNATEEGRQLNRRTEVRIL